MGLRMELVARRAARGSREGFVRAAAVLGLVSGAVFAVIPTFGTRSRHHGAGECSYEIVSRAPLWMWVAGLTGLVLANAALGHARGIRLRDTQANRVLALFLGLALFAAGVWFVWAQWGYHQISCEF